MTTRLLRSLRAALAFHGRARPPVRARGAALIGVALVGAWSLAGCGGKDDGPNPPDGQVDDTDTDTDTPGPTTVTYPPTRIGVGSCSDPRLGMPILEDIAADRLDLYIWGGDNVYGDTEDMVALQATYDLLAADAGYQALAAYTPFVATWDDHDYGANDAGSEYPMKEPSKQIFLDFWGEPTNSERRTREGIYTSYLYPGDQDTLQVIVLDTRWFRDPLLPNDGSGKHDYIPNPDPGVTLLGEDQWAWLETQLATPADLRLLVSSIQFGHSYNGWESWTNLPAERDRLLELIRTTQASGVVILSGDVHYAELSKIELAPGYDLYDLTASGITRIYPNAEENTNRVGEAYTNNNYGRVEIDWAARTVALSIVGRNGKVPLTETIAFEDISF